MISAIVTAIGSAMTGFVTSFGNTLVQGFEALFWDTTNSALTSLGEGLLAIAGISLVIACVMKVYHIFSGRLRRSC